ncbi:uncharacterized protein LOC141904335 [Tubulanus polymorphus]|uniref:uncharacterized protein LOC141904335 n=1 Tax=Tubulanus polymorphus TaxID=672921 RepID=UPI003DA366A7
MHRPDDKGLCFDCGQSGHIAAKCTDRMKCAKCGKQHLTSFHSETPSIPKEPKEPPPKLNEDEPPKPSGATISVDTENIHGTMAIIPVRLRLKGGIKEIETYCFLDPDSSISFCRTDLVEELGASKKPQRLNIGTANHPDGKPVKTNKVNGLEILELSSNEAVTLPTMFSLDELPVSEDHMPTKDEIAEWPHLDGIHMTRRLGKPVGLMIGSNVPDAFTPLEIRTGPAGSPYATRSRLGWITWNITRMDQRSGSKPVNRTWNTEESDLKFIESRLKETFNFDFPEKRINDKKEWSHEDQEFMNTIQKRITFRDGHYEIPLPLKSNVKLPCNKSLAVSCLNSLKRKLLNDEKLCNEYNEFMNKIIEKGFAEIVPADEMENENSWYLPHHAVRHPRKQKLRVVFNGAAKYQGVCLNDVLMQGPDLTNNLIGVLLRFRQWPVAVSADIESMFYQVRVPKEDSNLLRFLWWKDGRLDTEPICYRMVVHIFGSVSSPTCANLALRATAENADDHYDTESRQTILKSFYVDDCLKSFKSDQRATEVLSDTKEICADGGFRLHKILSNSRDVMESFSSEEWHKVDLDLEQQLPTERALGVSWDLETDNLTFQISIDKNKPITRRGILSTVSPVYDPLGLASPFILPAKILLQELRNHGWDEEVSEAQRIRFTTWLENLATLEEIKVPRSLTTSCENSTKHELRYFSDASESGYGVVCYLRSVAINGETNCTFMMSKSRVSPLKKITIQRLELTAAAIAVRMNTAIQKEIELEISDVKYWTDSKTVLRYICNDTARYQTFVANRVNTIREGSNKEQWRYVPSSLNPADLASRGVSPGNTILSERWFSGPAYLYQAETDWPVDSIDRSTCDDDVEIKKTKMVGSTISKDEPVHPIERLAEHYSCWWKLKRAVAWLIQCKKRLRNKVLGSDRPAGVKMYLTPTMLDEAEENIVKYVQKSSLGTEVTNLSSELSRVTKRSPLHNLDPYMKDDIIRVGGRLSRASIPYQEKHQIVLPKYHRVSSLIIEDAHKATGHMGKNSILAYIRKKFWIIHAGGMIKSITSKCVLCRKYNGKKANQKMADVPIDRLASDQPPFTNTGIDYFGPIDIKRGRSSVKRYGVVFTCMTCRAIHLESASSLETDACINAIRRFIARRGAVKRIRSDNGTNLVGAKSEMKRALDDLDQEKLTRFCSKNSVEWVFNPPLASHVGGIWERMIRSVRKIMFHLLRDQSKSVDDELLNTVLCEAEMILNNRPLYELESGNPNDPQPLTPNYLLLVQPKSDFPVGTFKREDSYSVRRWRQVQYLAQMFWKRWAEEYMHTLQVRSKWNRSRRNVTVGDVVLIMDTGQRNSWVAGRVTSVECDC